jgi:hypothetical protein
MILLLMGSATLHQHLLMVGRWSEPVDLPFLLSQTKYNWSLAEVDADIDSTTQDMVAQCDAGGKHK